MPYQIVYSSQATAPMTASELEKILEDARVGNEARGITGALIYVDAVFFQVLEGDREAVLELMASITRDARHGQVKVFYEAEVEARTFGSWKMAFLNPTAEEVKGWAGLPGTATIEDLLADVGGDSNRLPRFLGKVLEALAS